MIVNLFLKLHLIISGVGDFLSLRKTAFKYRRMFQGISSFKACIFIESGAALIYDGSWEIYEFLKQNLAYDEIVISFYIAIFNDRAKIFSCIYLKKKFKRILFFSYLQE